MDLIDKNCHRYLELYKKCVEEYPDTWHLDCQKPRNKLTKCAEMNPLVTLVRSRCSKHLELYDSCSKENPKDYDQVCVKHYNDFNKCAEQVVSEDGKT